MTVQEFSDQFDVLYNNITSNQAPGLNEYEKSLFLTKAEKEIVKNYFTANSKGNTIGQGFDDSAKRQADFSVLMKTSQCTILTWDMGTSTATIKQYACTVDASTKNLIGTQLMFLKNNIPYDIADGTYDVSVDGDNVTTIASEDTINIIGWPFDDGGELVISKKTFSVANGKIDNRSKMYVFPSDTFIVINEAIQTNANKYLQVIPLRFDEYTRLMSKPFKRPLKNQAWRLMNSGEVNGNSSTKVVEIITNTWDENQIAAYNIRYVRVPRPIIVADLDDLTIDGENKQSDVCEIDPILHDDILQRAVELAKIAWTATGQDNAQMVLQTGQRSE